MRAGRTCELGRVAGILEGLTFPYETAGAIPECARHG
jgi:hypothetical protein